MTTPNLTPVEWPEPVQIDLTPELKALIDAAHGFDTGFQSYDTVQIQRVVLTTHPHAHGRPLVGHFKSNARQGVEPWPNEPKGVVPK